ncbi:MULTISPECIES: hypothetical protein [Mycolicibacter]|uniref:Uncharacterized protein n=2 Tax=Mycolicibacter TaxID=1073531 RepID=A0ABU5XMJ6_9MYCO|nr:MULTISPECIES: hypothetical protein [unclassified Mycolicibacter]MEB3023424.1 hypothetical protein [Mycolicibacter sp. MYC098]MEB3033766.1 hypothetical protein [Mycolicibacter sp. MYC340]
MSNSTYDLDLSCSGDGWTATFADLIVATADDFLSDGPYGPVEITRNDGVTFTGELASRAGNALVIQDTTQKTYHGIHVDAVLRFRA